MMKVSTDKFKLQHQQAQALMICNVWDAASAKQAEQLGFQAIGTSSAAIANMLGYADGEQMNFEELLFVVKRIKACTSLPFSVDMEAGYSEDPLEVAAYITALSELGVVGINIEDSNCDGERKLVAANQFAGFLASIKGQLNKDKIDIFINARTDSFILGMEDAVAETQRRAHLYAAAGADGLFVPCLTQEADIQAVVSETELPVNIMCMPELTDFKRLSALGVKRISMGNFLFDLLQDEFSASLKQITQASSFKPIFA